MRIESPYHQGELLVQERTGERAAGERNGQVIADSILRGALPFIEKQGFAVLGSVDAEGEVWASLLLGEPGFLHARDDRTVEVDLGRAVRDREDPLWANLEVRPEIGMLLIELGRRRRLRLNGRLLPDGDEHLRLDVAESYPNCPKYINRRHMVLGAGGEMTDVPESRQGTKLQAGHLDLIDEADTFFVASVNGERGLDASHRGGAPGFVKILDEGSLRIPDYVGNSMFNTLGNLALDPRAGLVFLDFATGQTLQLVGRAELRFDLDDPDGLSGGTRRFWDFEIRGWRESRLPVEVSFEFLDASPFNLPV